jgi:thioredoxin reductase (NADPH)
VKVNLKMETSAKGLYAAGDIREDSVKQVVAAAGDGATAAINATKYIESKES